MSAYSAMPPVPTWDDEGSTIDLTPIDEIVDYVLTDHGVEIDWSTGDTREQVANQIGDGESVEQWEIHYLLRCVAHIALHPPKQLTAEEITEKVIAMESLGTWEERIQAAVYLAREATL